MIDIDVLLAWGAAYKKLSAGEIIFREGQACSFYHQVVSGKVKWLNIDDEGKECIHAIAGPGESFGEFPRGFDSVKQAKTHGFNRLDNRDFHTEFRPKVQLLYTRVLISLLSRVIQLPKPYIVHFLVFLLGVVLQEVSEAVLVVVRFEVEGTVPGFV